jgi:putative ABC transport system ATP-binding protein
MIIAKNLTKIYKLGKEEIVALMDVNLEINEGEFIAVMGPSGSGKSTLLHLLGCLDKPTSGQVYIDGMNTSELTDDELANIRNKKIGFIFQTFNLLPRLNIMENVELPLIYGKVSPKVRYKLTIESLNLVGLAERLRHKPSEISGGERQRVAIARALVNDPKIILADEPTGNLDTQTGCEIMGLLKKLNSERKTTIILVTHNFEMAKFSQKIYHLKDGRLVGHA